MLDREQKQNQSQSVDIAYEKHGIMSEFNCPYYTDERTEFFKQQRYHDEGTVAIKNKELYFRSQLVKGVIYEGRIKKVICHHLDTSSKKCNSPLSESRENKNCHIID